MAIHPLCSEHVPVSEPAVALSTFLLHHLPFSTAIQLNEEEWPYNTPTRASESPPFQLIPPTSTTTLTLPMEGNHYLSLHTTLTRSRANTISVLLWPDTLLINSSPMPVQVVEEWSGEKEAGRRETMLQSTEVGVVIGKEVSE